MNEHDFLNERATGVPVPRPEVAPSTPPPPPPPPNEKTRQGLGRAGRPATEPAHRTASSPDSPNHFPARAPEGCRIPHRLRRGVAALLLGLPLLLGPAAAAQAQQVLPVTTLDTAAEPMMLGAARTFTVRLDSQPPDPVHVRLTTQTQRSYRFQLGNEPIRFFGAGWLQPRMKSARGNTYDMWIEPGRWNTGYTVGIVGRTRSDRNSSGTLVFETALRPDTLIVRIDRDGDGAFDDQVTHDIQATHGRIEIPSCPYRYEGCLSVKEGGTTSYDLTLYQPPMPGESFTVTPSVDYQWPHHNFGPETRDGDVTFRPASVTWTRADWLQPGGRTRTVTVTAPSDDDDNDEHFTILHAFEGPFHDQRTWPYATGRKDDSIPAFDIVVRVADSEAGFCGRTKAVRDAIVRMIPGVRHCRDVTDTHLAAVTGNIVVNYLNLFNKGLSSLRAGDFDGLTKLRRLRLDRNQLTTLPAGIFDDLTALMTLDLDNNHLTTLRPDVFDSLKGLRVLYMNSNRLASLPDGVFGNNQRLASHWLHNNPGAPFRPTANAGTDQTVGTGEQVTLSGTATGPWASNDIADIAWQWRQVDGPNSNTLVQGGVRVDGQTATFTAPATSTVMHFRLAAIPKTVIERRPNSTNGYSSTGRQRGILDGFAWVTITVEARQASPQQAEPSSRQTGGGTDVGDDGKGPVGDDAGTVDIPAPVAHWRFDGDALDGAGSSHGTARGGAAFAANGDGSGVGSHALVLDGLDDHVDLAPHVSSFPLGNSARSVTGWFRADAGNQRQAFLAYGPNVEGKRFSVAADRTQVVVAVSGHAWGVNNLSLADGWHHIAVTFAGGRSDSFSIYLDGVLQSASTLGGVRRQVDTRTGPAAIGRSVTGNAHYGGDIDDVRLYDHALSSEQVRAIAGRK